MEKEFGLRVSLSLALEHYLSSGALTTCPRARLSAPTLSLILDLAPANTPPRSLSLLVGPSPGTLSGSRNLLVLLTSVKLSAPPFYCHSERSEA
jgi:hypothetical protein